MKRIEDTFAYQFERLGKALRAVRDAVLDEISKLWERLR